MSRPDIRPFVANPSCPKCKRESNASGQHTARFICEVQSPRDTFEWLDWICWFCGYQWWSFTADEDPRGR